MYEKLEKVLGEGVDIFNEEKMGSTRKEITKEEIDMEKLGKKYVDALDKKRMSLCLSRMGLYKYMVLNM